MSVAPLQGLKVVEFAGLAPGPFAGLILADWGASVTRIDRVGQTTSNDILCRGKRSLAINVKDPSGRKLLRKLIAQSDVLIDPFRPGVLDKLELGSDVFLGHGRLNKRLIYAALSGFQRDGSQASMAGHDLNYIAQSGVLSMLPGDTVPTFPLNLLADFGGGGFMCAMGILLAVLARERTGQGQVVHTDMVSGTRYLASFPLIHALAAKKSSDFGSPLFGVTPEARGTRLLDGGAPFYAVYACADGRWMSVACLEPQFNIAFIERFIRALPDDFDKVVGTWRPSEEARTDPSQWPQLRRFLAEGFRTKTRDEWATIFDGSDACAVPVLSTAEAASAYPSQTPLPHPTLTESPARELDASGLLHPGAHSDEILSELGLNELERKHLIETGVVSGIEKYEKARSRL